MIKKIALRSSFGLFLAVVVSVTSFALPRRNPPGATQPSPLEAGPCMTTCTKACLDHYGTSESNAKTKCTSACDMTCFAQVSPHQPWPEPNKVNHELCVAGCTIWATACNADLGAVEGALAVLSSFLKPLGSGICSAVQNSCVSGCAP